jgi:hypothetical protein
MGQRVNNDHAIWASFFNQNEAATGMTGRWKELTVF